MFWKVSQFPLTKSHLGGRQLGCDIMCPAYFINLDEIQVNACWIPSLFTTQIEGGKTSRDVTTVWVHSGKVT